MGWGFSTRMHFSITEEHFNSSQALPSDERKQKLGKTGWGSVDLKSCLELLPCGWSWSQQPDAGQPGALPHRVVLTTLSRLRLSPSSSFSILPGETGGRGGSEQCPHAFHRPTSPGEASGTSRVG